MLLIGLTGAVLAGLASATPAVAVGGEPVTDAAYNFVASVHTGTGENDLGCTGALVAPQWIATAKECFGQVALGAPARPATVTVGRTDLTAAGGHTAPVVLLVPHPDRNLVLAKLATPAAGVTPVPVSSVAPVAGERLTAAGFGRTRTQWVPDRLHGGAFDVTEVGASSLTLTGTAADSVICKGDAGGPAVRTTGSGPELVALHDRSWQGGCLGETETRRGAVETRLDDLGGWIRQSVADVNIFGATADGKLTWTAIASASGDRIGATVTSTQSLGFTPKAMATLNVNTVLVTNGSGVLYRVDVTGTTPALTFGAPVEVARGYTHDRLTFDGDGSLYGIAGDTLRRYTVTTAKPGPGNIINNTLVGSGFSLQSLTATGPDWILGATSAGVLRSYQIDAFGKWTGASLATSGWGGYTHLVSPGNGIYYGRTSAGRLARFVDAAPFDGKGTDIATFPNDPVDASGWDQALLSALPFRAFPQSPADVSVFGADAAGHLTYTAIDSATGDRVPAVTSAATLGFETKAMATLDHDTVLVTSTAGRLYRVDVQTTLPALTFAAPVNLAGGWTHDRLSYDGYGSLYGIAAGVLHRYEIGAAKPVAADITGHVTVGTGFGLTTLTATGPDWILGTTSAGVLISYNVDETGKWTRYELAASGWTGLTHLVSPGNGFYYARTTAGGLNRYKDALPFDGKGTDIQRFDNDPVDTAGWTQRLLSAQPFTA
uniref:trypsin-like serine protease n=1 Tax=Paractinoplanes polyasparticus TaxID=2856853 RepID=UPI001C863928|nr:trypsin-like serine protease [Actinoplanes polyasparticus]